MMVVLEPNQAGQDASHTGQDAVEHPGLYGKHSGQQIEALGCWYAASINNLAWNSWLPAADMFIAIQQASIQVLLKKSIIQGLVKN